jgi:hypothetical protein
MATVPLHYIQIMHAFIFCFTKASDNSFHIRAAHLDIIEVLFIHQMMH